MTSWNKWGKLGERGEKWQKVGKSDFFFKIWMTKNHFRLHFSPFQINTQFFFFEFFFLEVRFAPKTIGFFHYVLSMAMPNMKLIGEFVTELEMPQAF